MNYWDCGTTMCIGGTMSYLMGCKMNSQIRVSEYCGFGPNEVGSFNLSHPFYELMYGKWMYRDDNLTNPRKAAEKINEFLFKHGYPPEEIKESEEHEGVIK